MQKISTVTHACFQSLRALHLLSSQWSQQITWPNPCKGAGKCTLPLVGRSAEPQGKETEYNEGVKNSDNNSVNHGLHFQV